MGNVRQLTNSSGATTDTYEYDVFGNKISSTGATPNNYLYRGEQYDQDLGLYYLRARYDNPLTGRFMSRDPEDGHRRAPKSLHKYLYAAGDPVNRIDPRGRDALVEYRVTTICGGTVYCGPAVTWAGVTKAAAWALIASELAEFLDSATNPEAPPPAEHNPDEPEPGDDTPPAISAPVGGSAPPPPPPEPPY